MYVHVIGSVANRNDAQLQREWRGGAERAYLYLVDTEVVGGPHRRPTPAGENTSAVLPIRE